MKGAGSLSKETIEAARKGTKYTVTSFDKGGGDQDAKKKVYSLKVDGMT